VGSGGILSDLSGIQWDLVGSGGVLWDLSGIQWDPMGDLVGSSGI